MGVWGFDLLCWPFSHTEFKPKFYCISMTHLPTGTMGFILKFFVSFGFWRFLPHFACHPILSGFLSMVLVVILDCQFYVNLTTFLLWVCIGMHVVFLSLDFVFSWVCLFLSFNVLIQPFYFYLCVDGAPIHEHICMHYRDLERPKLPVAIGWSFVH